MHELPKMRPNFLCIGTFRTGTTWLFHVLKGHPEVFLPKEKELMFFTLHYERGIDWYDAFFANYRGQKYAGDISPSYLSSEETPKRMRKHLSDVKMLAILRNPADQIWSLYNLWLNRGYTTKDLKSAIREKPEFLNNVLYYKHLSNYLGYFDRKDLLILFYEDLKADPFTFLKSLYSHLEIDEIIQDDFVKVWNKTRKPRSILLEKALATTGDFLRRSGLISLKTFLNKTCVSDIIRFINTLQSEEQAMPQDIRSFVNAYVAEDSENLAKLVNRSLSFWG